MHEGFLWWEAGGESPSHLGPAPVVRRVRKTRLFDKAGRFHFSFHSLVYLALPDLP